LQAPLRLAISGARKEIAMPGELRWDDAEDLGIALVEKYPQQNPLEVRFTDLHRYVIELPGFADDPKTSNEAKLEAIQMAWYEEWKDSQG
jgi:FeS assembly protein IscX